MLSPLDTLAPKRDQFHARLPRLPHRPQAPPRQDDTRRNILVGSKVLDHLDKGPGKAGRFLDALDTALPRDRDLALFHLLPKPSDSETLS